MNKHRAFLLGIMALSVTACTQAGPQAPTRLETSPLGFHASVLSSDGMTEQARELNAHANAIVRASTLKGAMIGAAVGCGLGVLTASNASSCIPAAAVGAAGGAVIGNAAGKREVQRRVKLASPNALVRNLRKANGNLASIQSSLPDLLAAQDAELSRLSLSFAAGQVSKENHDKKAEAIRRDRAKLAEALMTTAQQSQKAAANLRAAAQAGHTGLDWHIGATEKLARDALSSRSNITLL